MPKTQLLIPFTRNEAQVICFILFSGKTESEKCSHSHSEMILRIMDEVRKQIDLTYSEDS